MVLPPRLGAVIHHKVEFTFVILSACDFPVLKESLRFQRDLAEMRIDFGMPATTSTDEVHDKCREMIGKWSVSEAGSANHNNDQVQVTRQNPKSIYNKVPHFTFKKHAFYVRVGRERRITYHTPTGDAFPLVCMVLELEELGSLLDISP